MSAEMGPLGRDDMLEIMDLKLGNLMFLAKKFGGVEWSISDKNNDRIDITVSYTKAVDA